VLLNCSGAKRRRGLPLPYRDPSCRPLGVLFLPDEIELGRADVGVARELAGLVQLGTILDRIIERRLSQTVHTDPAGAQAVRGNAGRDAMLFHNPPDGFAAERCTEEGFAVRGKSPEEGTLDVIRDPGAFHVVEDRPGRFEQNLSLLLAAFLGDIQKPLRAVELQVPDAGPVDRGYPTGGYKEGVQEGTIAESLERARVRSVQKADGLLFGERGGRVLLHLRRLHGRDVLGGLPCDEFFCRELVVHTAEHRHFPGDRRGRLAGIPERRLVKLHVVGGHLKRPDTEPLHVPEKIPDVLTVDFDAPFRLEHVAHPGDECLHRVSRVVGAGDDRHDTPQEDGHLVHLSLRIDCLTIDGHKRQLDRRQSLDFVLACGGITVICHAAGEVVRLHSSPQPKAHYVAWLGGASGRSGQSSPLMGQSDFCPATSLYMEVMRRGCPRRACAYIENME